ncbi:hypothetical protein NQ314_010355, partial [Rhamnusium bicolor]
GPDLIRVSRFFKEAKEGKFISYIYPDAKTLYESFRRGSKVSNDGPCLGWRESYSKPYQWLSYNEALLRAKNFGSGLVASGLLPGSNTILGIYSQNCPEWILTEQAAYCYSMVLVPLYDTLGPDACAFIIKQAEISIVVCEDDAKCNLMLEKSPRCLKKLIIMKDIRVSTKQKAKNMGVEIVKLSDIELLGSKRNHPEVPPKPSDLATICYTSGTTGNPKGVMLTHENIVASMSAVMLQLGDHKLRSTDTLISGIIRNNSFWDMMVFRKVQEGMGGKLRFMLVGSAPLAESVLTFVRCALGCLVVEGYGQTECTAPITLTIQGDHIPGHVGPPVACCCVKLVDVPEMEYWSKNNQGEVCVKGTNVFQGYYKDPEKTEENGTLKIIDRRKHIFKLSQGEYIVPEKIENIYIRSQYVSQVFVHGESLKSCIIAIVVPDVDVIKCWAQENGIPGTFSVLCNNSEVKQLIFDDMISWGKEAGLKSFEQIKDIYLHPDNFSIQNGLLTPTMKSKRPQLKAYFKPQLDDMYSRLT